jgi:2-oxoglutarate dehydrogenase E2 component (dihydrolipoamide succinyltransferase)
VNIHPAIRVLPFNPPQGQLVSRISSASSKLTVKVPEMAESISEGTIIQLFKSIGDHIEANEKLADIETDKLDVSVRAPEAGIVHEILVQEGDTVNSGMDVARIRVDVTDKGERRTAASDSKFKGKESTTTGKEHKKDDPCLVY